MKLIVTCGPASEPIDTTRRITNFSTGRLGTTLAALFYAAGHEVLCFRGAGATYREVPEGVQLEEFQTNADLEGLLTVAAQGEKAGEGHKIGAIFQVAALCDFAVEAICDSAGNYISSGKLPSRADGYRIQLRPLPKLLPRLRDWFPDAFLVGWKYETEGGKSRLIELGERQLREAGTDLCVLNGAGYGTGFGLLTAQGVWAEAVDATQLGEQLHCALMGRLKTG